MMDRRTLAMQYFPDRDPVEAVRSPSRMIAHCPLLVAALNALGEYRKKNGPVQFPTDCPVQFSTDCPVQFSTDCPIQFATDCPIQLTTDCPIQFATDGPVQFSRRIIPSRRALKAPFRRFLGLYSPVLSRLEPSCAMARKTSCIFAPGKRYSIQPNRLTNHPS